MYYTELWKWLIFIYFVYCTSVSCINILLSIPSHLYIDNQLPLKYKRAGIAQSV
jgi:hypothetical protein